MAYLRNIAAVICVAAFALNLPTGTEGNPYVISDNRVKSLDVTPVLGRGYSIMTNSFQSTCIEVEEITTPSFNYDYSFYDFTGSTDVMVDLAEGLSESFAYDELKEEFDSTYSTETTETINTHYIIASMRVERYYASIKEEASTITSAAMSLLGAGDYIGFFKACGPNYVRSIRRGQEVTAQFKFESSNTETAQAFASSLQTTSESGDESSETLSQTTKFSSITSTMTIKIKGFGLGLTKEGSETLMATSLAEFNGVMKFAFNVMTKAPDAHHIGMVYGIEVVPWVENAQFQVAANIGNENVEIPIPRSLIPLAFRIANKTDTTFIEAARDDFKCKNAGYSIDRYGYCCEAPSLYNHLTQQYTIGVLSELTCRPIRKLDGSIVKENMSGNGEFVARLDRALRYKSNLLSTLQKCISTIRSYPTSVDNHYLKPNADPLGLQVVKLTVFDMKMAMDPFNDYSMVKHMGREIDEFIDMYYAPCMAALFGANVPSGTDVSYFLAYPWHSHKECTYMSCLATGMRWDRTKGGCVPSLMNGGTDSYPDGADAKCSYDLDSEGDEQVCKYPASALNLYTQNIKECWDGSGMETGFSVQLYLTNYCMPSVSAQKMDQTVFDLKLKAIPQDCGGTLGAAVAPARTKRTLSRLEAANLRKQENIKKRRGR